MNEAISAAIERLDPAQVWRLFAGMAAVPRASKKEQRIRAHVRALAEGMGFAVREDRVGNLVIGAPATPGRESAPITVLQGHLDMVCEKNSDTQHDFDNVGVHPLIDVDEKGEQIVRAKGTTLGADNGVGVCMALAAASSRDVVHGPLEILCTVDEEMGMTGAKALKPGFFKGKRMINLDSEEDDAVYIGCAGGCDTNLSWGLKLGPKPKRGEVCTVNVTGLKGGHSGGDIHLNRANAIKLLVQVLNAAPDVQLVEINGGSKRNAIPREASALVVGPAGTAKALGKAARKTQAEAIEDAKETSCKIRVQRKGVAKLAASATDSRRVLATIEALPHGVLAVVPEIPGLVRTSNGTSIAISEIAGKRLHVTVQCLSRSSSEADVEATVRRIHAIGALGGAKAESGNGYPGWAPNVNSPLLATCKRVYERLFDESPRVAAIHAGLECGIIGRRMGNIDMVSFGPHITGAHSPDEQVWVGSVQKAWRYLTAVLGELAGSRA